MAGPPRITTPLGELTVVVASGGSVLGQPDRAAALPSGAWSAGWDDLHGLVVDALVTQYEWPLDPCPGWAPVTCWGVELRLHTRTDTGPVEVSARLPEGTVEGYPDGDEGLAIVEFETQDWVLALGGPDDAVLGDGFTDGNQPSSARHVGPPVAVRAALTWNVPALTAGEGGRLHVAAAWSPKGHPRSDDTPWFAVGVLPEHLREAAGVRLISFPAKRRRRRAR